jgi:hypothetical protein
MKRFTPRHMFCAPDADGKTVLEASQFFNSSVRQFAPSLG